VVLAGFFRIPVFARESAFRASFASDVKLLVGQLFLPLSFGLNNFIGHDEPRFTIVSALN
jgi:hypothetical protein